MIVYPRSSGSGIKACPWVETVCRLAGIQDIGVKVRCWQAAGPVLDVVSESLLLCFPLLAVPANASAGSAVSAILHAPVHTGSCVSR